VSSKRQQLFEILREHDMPAYPTAARAAGISYTDYLTGAGQKSKGVSFQRDPETNEEYVYTPHRNRQCSIGHHEECSDPEGETCGCPCHPLLKLLGEDIDADEEE
jgi:hypothetical protein